MGLVVAFVGPPHGKNTGMFNKPWLEGESLHYKFEAWVLH